MVTTMMPPTTKARTKPRVGEQQKQQDISPQWAAQEIVKCAASAIYFIDTYCNIYDASARGWIPFKLWKKQREIAHSLQTRKLNIALKSRQVGMTWLGLCYNLWGCLFCPIWRGLLFSKRDDEATEMLSDNRFQGVYKRLPDWMRALFPIVASNEHQVEFANGSTTYAFPTTGGDSYTATFAMIDEADLLDNLDRLMGSVKPTIEAGGQLFILSRADKSKPRSRFKRMFKAARKRRNGYAAHFVAWNDHPDRTEAWYATVCQESIDNVGNLDEAWEQYPASIEEALASKSNDKRMPPTHLMRVYEGWRPLDVDRVRGAPSINGLQVFLPPQKGRKYCGGADPAEGNPNSDDSSFDILDAVTGEQVCHLSGKFEISVFGAHIAALSKWYNNAPVLPERNNHGHALILWLKGNARGLRILLGTDKKPGWVSTTLGKSLIYDDLATEIKEEQVLIHCEKTYDQLGELESATLRAPKGMNDDAADSFAFASKGRAQALVTGMRFEVWD